MDALRLHHLRLQLDDLLLAAKQGTLSCDDLDEVEGENKVMQDALRTQALDPATSPDDRMTAIALHKWLSETRQESEASHESAVKCAEISDVSAAARAFIHNAMARYIDVILSKSSPDFVKNYVQVFYALE